MTLITAKFPQRSRQMFFHSFGPQDELFFTEASAKAWHFGSHREAHRMRESRAFWAGLEASVYESAVVGIAEQGF